MRRRGERRKGLCKGSSFRVMTFLKSLATFLYRKADDRSPGRATRGANYYSEPFMWLHERLSAARQDSGAFIWEEDHATEISASDFAEQTGLEVFAKSDGEEREIRNELEIRVKNLELCKKCRDNFLDTPLLCWEGTKPNYLHGYDGGSVNSKSSTAGGSFECDCDGGRGQGRTRELIESTVKTAQLRSRYGPVVLCSLAPPKALFQASEIDVTADDPCI